MRVKDPSQLRNRRRERQFSQRDLAFLVKKSQTSIYALETGRLKTISAALARSIAARLEVPCEQLFDAEEAGPGMEAEMAAVTTPELAVAAGGAGGSCAAG